MALSEKWVLEKARALLWNPDYTGFNPIAFTRAIEAEVRKDDEALIRQMLESMCWAARVMAISEDEAPGYFAAITAACARLEQP